MCRLRACRSCSLRRGRVSIACVEPYVKDTPGKRLVELGGSWATGMYTNFHGQGPEVEGVDKLSYSRRNADFVTNTMGADEVVDHMVESVPGWVKAWVVRSVWGLRSDMLLLWRIRQLWRLWEVVCRICSIRGWC